MQIKSWLLCATLGLAAFANAETKAIIDTNFGKIGLSLDEEKAPKTVANFVEYAKSGFYNQTIFHRVIDGFMIQGGGLTQDLLEKKTRAPIVNESANGLKNDVGTIAMARLDDPNSATSQFFINLVDNHYLDYQNGKAGYTVFGKVSEGMDVVNKIAKVRTTSKMPHQNVPKEPVIVKTIEILQ